MADRSVKVTLRGDVSDFNRAMLAGAASAKAFTASLDTSTNRASNFTQSILAIGPALVPIGAAAIPAISGLTNQLAFAAAGAGVAAVAFSGVGDALDAVNDYSIDPTTANFEKMRQSLDTLGPAGENFVHFLQSLRPEMQQLQNAAQAGLFPGMEAGLTDLMRLLPQAERIVSQVAGAMGDVMAEAGDNLNDPRWREFFTFLEMEARPTLLDMGRTLGNFAEGFANLWMAFDPLSDQFSNSFLQMSRDFAEWTSGLSETQGFQEFLDYISRVGPKVGDALGAIGNAFLAIIQAAAPVGEIVLPAIEALADVLAAVANSPAGPVLIGAAVGISAISRAIALYNIANGSALLGLLGGTASKGRHAATAAAGLGRGYRLAAGGVLALGLSMTDLDDKIGLSNTAMGAALGLMAGPWGAAIGAGVGLAMDFAAANDGVWQAIEQANAVMSNAGASVGQLNAAYAAAATTVADFKKSVDDVSLTDFASLKNSFEDAFGRSDVEEAEAALGKLKVSRDEAIAKAQEQMFAEAGLSGAMAGASQATRDQTAALLENIAAKNAAADAALNAFGAETAYREALKSARDQADKNNKGIQGDSDAVLANRNALNQLASSWNRVADAGNATEGSMKKARKNFIAVAVDMGVGRDRAKQLAKELLHIPSPKPKVTLQDNATPKARAIQQHLNKVANSKPNPKVNADTGQARNKLSGVIALLRRIVSKSIRIHTTYTASQRGGHPTQRRADGGYIAGPGGPRDDAIPAWLSDGEYVINAAATKRFMPLLDKINAQKFAVGGPVPQPLSVGSFATAMKGDGAAAPAAFPTAELERAMNRVFDGRTFDARVAADGRTAQIKWRRGR